jgi:hypothetical protein
MRRSAREPRRFVILQAVKRASVRVESEGSLGSGETFVDVVGGVGQRAMDVPVPCRATTESLTLSEVQAHGARQSRRRTVAATCSTSSSTVTCESSALRGCGRYAAIVLSLR